MNEKLLEQFHPGLASRLRTMLMSAGTSGLPPYDLFMGLRTWKQQDDLYALGRTQKNPDGISSDKLMGRIVTNAKGGDSFHNYGLAADIVFRPDGNWSWDDSLPWAKLGALGQGIGLEWGGTWKFKDLPHFQYVGKLTIARAKELYSPGGLLAVWREVA